MSRIYSFDAISSAASAAPKLTILEGQQDLRSKDSFTDGKSSEPAPIEDPSALLVASPEGLRDLLKDINQSDLPLDEYSRKDERGIDALIRHESAHARAAAVVGATATEYGVRFFWLEDLNNEGNNQLTYEAFTSHNFNTRMPSLLLASVIAYPLDPSEGDLADIRGLGFRDIEDVGERIVSANWEYDIGIPAPMSYMPPHGSMRMMLTEEPTYLRTYGT